MSLSGAVIDALLATGATREQIAAAVKADIAVREAEEAAKLEAKRRGNRERQQRKRERERNAESRVTSVTARDERDPAPNERENLTPTSVEKPSPNGEVKKAERGFRLPEDWQPKPLAGQAATMVARWLPGEIERELAKFKNYWLAKGANAARTDWQRTWVNWLIAADERKPRHERPDTNPTGTALRRVHEALRSGGPVN